MSLIKKAQLAAKPSPEYLLNRAKKWREKGNDFYGMREFSKAIHWWKKAIEEYDRARELASQRGDTELIPATFSAIKSIKIDIMHTLIEWGNMLVNESKKLFNRKHFDDAKNNLENALKKYGESKRIAEELNLRNYVVEIERIMENIKISIKTCLIAKIENLIEDALTKTHEEKERAFIKVIDYIRSIAPKGEREFEILMKKALRGLLNARIEIGKREIEKALNFFENGEYYKAKNAYKSVQDYLERLRDFAVENEFVEEKRELDELIEECTTMIKHCTDALIGERPIVAPPPIPRHHGILLTAKIREIASKSFTSDFEIIEFIGSGGASHVYKARMKNGDVVALKIPNINVQKTLTRKDVEDFIREAKIWRMLDHPNIVKVIAYGCGRIRIGDQELPVPWIALELMECSLRDKLKESALPLREALSIALQIADALHYAAMHGVHHYDIKPENILFTRDGKPKLSDWGIARIMLRASSKSTSFKGTLLYSAPEQVAPEKFGDIDWRTSIYQLGAVLYEMLTGKPPFQSDSLLQLIKMIIEEEPIPPSKINPEIPKEVDRIVLKALAKRKEDRYYDISLFLNDIKEILNKLQK